MPTVRRVVIGPNKDKKSAVILRDSPNHQEVPELYWSATLWATTELPADNTIPGDRGADVTRREPAGTGLIFRALEVPRTSPTSAPTPPSCRNSTKSSSRSTRRHGRTWPATPACTAPTR